MTSPCQSRNGPLYARTHNAPTFIPALQAACRRDDLPLGLQPGRSRLIRSARDGSLPALTVVVPDQCSNMHFDSRCASPPRRSTFLANGDRWLRHWLSPLLRSHAYRDGSTVVFVTWDEGTPLPAGRATLRCPAGAQTPQCGVALIVISPYTAPGTVVDVASSHLSLLALTEGLLGARPVATRFSTSTPDFGARFGLKGPGLRYR